MDGIGLELCIFGLTNMGFSMKCYYYLRQMIGVFYLHSAPRFEQPLRSEIRSMWKGADKGDVLFPRHVGGRRVTEEAPRK